MKRPRLLLILLLLVFAQGAMFLTFFALYGLNAMDKLNSVLTELMLGQRGPQGLISLGLLTGTWLVSGLASVIVGVGLRRWRPWAWTAALTLEGAILILALEAYFNRKADVLFYIAMGLAVAIVLVLNQREVQILYRAHPEPFEGPFGR